jgi:hypothetical protein
MTTRVQLTLDDIRQRARRLENAMDAFRGDDPSEFIAAMTEYVELVDYINDRLTDAHRLLAQGNRSDAISSIEAEPNILECMQEIDATDAKAQEWGDTCDIVDTRRPATLLVDLANELSSQYDVKHQLADLLRKHRLLALGGAPLEQRMHTLRNLLRLDPDNVSWQEDLKKYESHCQRILRQELDALDRKLNDGATMPIAKRIDEVCGQLSDAEWQEPVDAPTVRKAQAVQARMRKLLARLELTTVAQRLVEFRGQDDPHRAQVLLTQWERLAGQGTLSPEDELAASTMEDRERCEALVAQATAAETLVTAREQLGAVCSKPSPRMPGAVGRHRRELQSAFGHFHSAATQAGADAEIEQWNQAVALKDRELGGRMRTFWAMVCGGALFVAAAGTAVGTTLWQQSNKKQVLARSIDQLEEMQRTGKHDDIPDLLDRMTSAHPWLAGHERVDEIVTTADREKQKANEAKRDTEQALEVLKERIESAAAALGKIKDFNGVDAASKEAKTAADSARNAVEQGLANAVSKRAAMRQGEYMAGGAGSLDDEIEACRRQSEEQKKALKDWAADVREREVTRLTKLIRDCRVEGVESKAFQKEIDDIKSQITTLERFFDSKEAALAEQLDVRVDAWKGSSEMDALRRDLDKASERGALALIDALEDAAGRLPENLAEETEAVAASRQCVEAATAWGDVARLWQPRVTAAPEVLRALKKALEQTEKLPLPYAEDDAFAERRDLLVDCLEEMTQGEGKISEQLEKLERLLATEVLQDKVIEVVIEDAPYYTTEAKVKIRPGYFVDEDRFDDKQSEWNTKEIKERVDQKQFTESRNVGLARALRELVKRIKKGEVGLEDGVVKIIETVLLPPAQPRGVSPPDDLLRAKILILATDIALGRVFLEEVPSIVKLSDDLGAGVGQVSWVLYRKPYSRNVIESSQERVEAKTILSRSPDLKESIARDVLKKQEELGKKPAFCRPLRYVGWVDKAGNELRLSGVPKSAKDAKGSLFVVNATEDGDVEWSLQSCGTMRDGKASLERVKDVAMFGRPVFVEAEPVVKGKAARGN